MLQTIDCPLPAERALDPVEGAPLEDQHLQRLAVGGIARLLLAHGQCLWIPTARCDEFGHGAATQGVLNG